MKKIYVIQYRTDISEEHEQKCLREELDVADDQLVFVNAVKGDMLTSVPEDAAAVILGGSGQYYISKGDGDGTWLQGSHSLIQDCVDKNIPLLGICFGYQLLCLYLGAELVDNEEMRETGSFEVTQLDDANDDPIFSGISKTFFAHFGHKDTIVNLPENLIPVCRTKRVACSAVRLKDKDIWGVLFHAELDKDKIKERIEIFPNYTRNADHMKEVMDAIKDSPEATRVLTRFVEYALSK